jgi:formamidopyrimidine-DNA glycosylase
MPELAEVEFFRKRWSVGHGDRVIEVLTHDRAKVFRECDIALLKQGLSGATLLGSETAAKQMLFCFANTPPRTAPKGASRAEPGVPLRAESRGWLGIHLGMTGELRVEPPGYVPQKHDHFVLRQKLRSLVFNDPRTFGAVRFTVGPTPPDWWTRIAPAILTRAFTLEAVVDFLRRRARAPIKAVLLMQERFPGIGNWMADEVLWRAGIHPKRAAGSLTPAEVRALHRECRNLCRLAFATIAGRGDYLPPDLNVHIPKSWLFWHRWEKGGLCPRTGAKLVRETVGGRTTCWSPARQKLR